MGIQEVLTHAGPVDVESGQRGPGASGERRVGVSDGDTDRFIVSSQAKALYEAERNGKFDVVRERVRLGYYLKKDVLEQVIAALAKEVSSESMSKAAL